MGNPLSQTLFTSIYLDKLLWPVPKTFEEARFYRGQRENEDDPPLVHLVLRAYCLALVKACDFVLTRVTAEYYYEVGDLFFAAAWEPSFDHDIYRKRISLPSSTTAVSSPSSTRNISISS